MLGHLGAVESGHVEIQHGPVRLGNRLEDHPNALDDQLALFRALVETGIDLHNGPVDGVVDSIDPSSPMMSAIASIPPAVLSHATQFSDSQQPAPRPYIRKLNELVELAECDGEYVHAQVVDIGPVSSQP